MTVEKIVITEAKVHELFVEISKELGFSDEDILCHSQNILELIEMFLYRLLLHGRLLCSIGLFGLCF